MARYTDAIESIQAPELNYRRGILDYLSNGADALSGSTGSYGGLLDAAARQEADRNAKMALAGELLNAGGYSPERITLGQAIGRGMSAASKSRQGSVDQALQAALLKKQLSAVDQDNSRPIAVIDPGTGKPKFVSAKDAIGMEPHNAVQRAEAPAVIQEYNLYAEQEKMAGRQPAPYMTWLENRAKANVGSPYQFVEYGGGTGAFDKTNRGITQVTTAAQEAAGQGTVDAGKATGKGNAERNQIFINEGLAAADSLPVLNRAIELLDTVKTGGIDNLKLQASNMFGVTGADEAELSANMGKAVLSQLRSTFGAAFTEREGARLQEIEAGFGKSTDGNKRLLQQARKLVERAARRGMSAAQSAGDDFAYSEIESSMNMRLAPDQKAPSNAPSSGVVNWDDL